MKVWTEFSIISGLLYYQHPHLGEVLCIPNIYDAPGMNHRRRIFNESHVTDYVGHRGITTTKATMRCRYYWSELTADAIKMVNACHECNTSKINRQKPQGKLMPIDVPLFPAQSYNTDIIGPLPESKNGNHCVLIVVDRFSSRIFLHAHSKHTTATEMAQLFVDEICYKAGRGIPLSVISDNDKLFTAQFFKSMFERFGTKWLFSTARSQSTDGKAERYIAVVEEILRTRINYKQTDWEVLLSAIMFINNQQKCSLLNQTPIEIEMNITPIVPADLISRVTLEKAVKKNTVVQYSTC